MNPTQLFDPTSSTYTYIVFDEWTREAVIIDPVQEQLERDLAALERLDVRLKWTLETHAHADHITSAARLAELTGAHIAAPAGCAIGTAAVQLVEGDVLPFGAQRLQALATPGHTAGSMCFYWERASHARVASADLGQTTRPEQRQHERHVFTGDTLLIQGCGRTDFQSGSAERLWDSITGKLFVLPNATTVWPAHDYEGRTRSTIGVEKATNPRLAGKTREEFVALMGGLNLPKPERLDEAVPANQRSGLRQDADAPGGAPADAVQPALGYAGDMPPAMACAWWQQGRGVLIDVRTDAEREWVGFVPGALAAAWKQWPGMAPNPAFDAALQSAGQDGKPLLLLCRSGVRSAAAARRATELGLTAYNISGGFEGDLDEHAQRGQRNGWRHAGLPWRQN